MNCEKTAAKPPLPPSPAEMFAILGSVDNLGSFLSLFADWEYNNLTLEKHRIGS